MLRELADITDGFATDQLTHCLQTATRAERDGADVEVVVASLCHDVGKRVSVHNHAAIAAEMLNRTCAPTSTTWSAPTRTSRARHYYEHLGLDPDARAQYEGESLYDLTANFADNYDQNSFDPDYDTLPLEHFEDRVRLVFGALGPTPLG